MAGKLVVNTINTDTAGAVFTTQNAVTGIAKAWAQIASNGAINGSFNVSSVTKTTTGEYTLNFTTAMPNANYAFNMSVVGAAARFLWSGTPSTSSVTVALANSSQVLTDTGFSFSAFSS